MYVSTSFRFISLKADASRYSCSLTENRNGQLTVLYVKQVGVGKKGEKNQEARFSAIITHISLKYAEHIGVSWVCRLLILGEYDRRRTVKQV